jgi:molybdate transport system substrate-binding protein
MTKLFLGTVAAAWLVLVTAASAAEIKVLAAGGMRPGLNAAAKVFREQTGVEVKFTYEPPVDLGKRVAGGETADIVVSSPAIVADLAKAGKVLSDRQMHLGRVGVGVVARDGVPLPDVSSVPALKSAAVIAAAPNPDAAKAFMTYLASPDGRTLFVANGIPE